MPTIDLWIYILINLCSVVASPTWEIVNLALIYWCSGVGGMRL